MLLVPGRRILFRSAVAAAALGAMLSCGEGTTESVHPGLGRIAVAPILPAGGHAIGLPLDNVRLIVIRPPTDTLLDRTYNFPAGQNQLSIAEPVLRQAPSEELLVVLLLLSDTARLFSDSLLVEVRQGSAGSNPIPLEMHYVGPGRQVARIRLAPRDTVVSFGASLPFEVIAVDSQGASVSQFYVSWQSSDPGRTPDGAGVLAAGTTRDTLLIRAVTPTGIRDSTTVTILAPAARLVKTGGDGQSALVGSRLSQPLEVEVRGSDDLPLPGVVVSFAAPAGGSVDNATAATDQAGRARTGATLGPAAGQQSFTATVTGAGSVSFSATATQPAVTFVAASQTVAESDGTANIAVQLSGVATLPVTVPFGLSGTASSPADYTVTSPLVIPAGSSGAGITVSVSADGLAEPDETVILTLGTPTNAVLGATTVHTLTIAGQTPSVSFSSPSQTVSEGVGSTTIVVQLSTPSARPVTIPFTRGGTATTPADYGITASPLTIPAGSTSGTLTVTVVADALAESNETVIVTLGTPTNATLGPTTVHTLTITGQVPVVSLVANGQAVTETVGSTTIAAQLSIPSTSPVTVPFTVAGTAASPADFTISTSPLTIPAGSTSGTIAVTVVADAIAEPNETVIVTLGTPTNATLGTITTHTVTILGQQPTVSFTTAGQTAGEGAGPATITARLSGPSTSPVTLPFTFAGTAAAGTDYTITASPLIIPAGDTSGNITVTPVNDALVESAETVIVTLGTPTNATLGATTQHTLTIADNDLVLTVVLGGRGSGTVATAPGFTPAINCTTGGPAAQCVATYQAGTQVSLVATPFPTTEGINRFEGWSGTGTGFTCTTSTTCTVSMDQARQATARFSIPGSITFTPGSASFGVQQRGTPPPPVAVSAANTGERPLQLAPEPIPVTYTPANVTPWLGVTIDRLVIDTLMPANLTLSVGVAATALPFGTYQASVLVRDAGLQFSWILPVTLTVIPPPTPPTISNVTDTLIQLNDAARCTLGTPAASSFRIRFDYTDPNGNGPTNISQAGLNISYVFRPQSDSGGFSNYTYMSSLTGNGSTGSAITTQCYRFGTNTSVDVTMTIVDQGGLRSAGGTTTIRKPTGSN